MRILLAFLSFATQKLTRTGALSHAFSKAGEAGYSDPEPFGRLGPQDCGTAPDSVDQS